MHLTIALSIIIWLQAQPIGSVATASVNTTAAPPAPQIHTHPENSSNLRHNAAEIINYHVPGTTTVIHFILDRPLPAAVMSHTITSAYNHIVSVIASEGDSILPKSEDPFLYNKGYGAFIKGHSAKGRHLTWSLLEGAVVGLHNGLFLRGHYKSSEFWILDRVAGSLGFGEMRADVVGGGGRRNETVGWREVGGVEERSSNADADEWRARNI